MIEELPDRLEKALQETLREGENVLIKIKGAFKEGLICTDSRVIILKGGAMTGQMFGTNTFQASYRQIAGVEVKFHIMSGYFELNAGGMQNTAKSYWSSDKNSDPAKAPNCISLNSKSQAQKFRDACSFIMEKMDEVSNATNHPQDHQQSDEHGAIMSAIEKLGEMHKTGILTDDEFSAKKADLLARL